MKFRFCGELDCPDWVLAEISTLSKITSVKMRLLCGQVIKDLLGECIDYGKVEKLTSDAKYDLSDVKASIAALSFILSSAAKYRVDGDSLSNELQQLGLPKEHSVALCKTYADNLVKLQGAFLQRSLKVNKLSELQWRVDYVLGSSELHEIKEPEVQLRFDNMDVSSGAKEFISFSLTARKFSVLLSELKQAQRFMEGF
ncbi:COMM domain-containing protein 4 [Acropora cervicornis]|uniref:COMM domain-containing protein 4 n=1 Tax=Acropora cervicornis TaxID=6130 RepID=A0AAD9UUS7_ACRCE|nr:PREDICTED: COMM domain-containing protein 4-like [Acropora digitifera]XP_029205562.1 COMM domain-containing protein 4-like [Acropora millepora]KAK2550400.1 COMM domain-containing protein 4 [Acropora cervicornis]